VGKRALDVVLGTALALLLLPLMLLLAVAAAITFRCWPLFVHERIGQGGRRIRFVKLRSLPRETPKYARKDRFELNAPPFGRFMRSTHLDELPQLFLVPFGHLSLVGPRPAMPEEHEPVDSEYREVRLTVPQGCTGLWQIGQHTDHLPSHAPEYDLFYVEHASVRLDLLIMWWTALSMLGIDRRTRSIDDIPAWARRRVVSVADEPMPAWPAAGGAGVESAVALSSQASSLSQS